MPVRATKRGDERTALRGDYDVLICGASFAGLTVARELARTRSPARPRVLMIDRYEIGEKQTSACAAPTEWLERLDLMDAVQQTFTDLLIHVPGRSMRWTLPWTFSTFDYRRICALLRAQSEGSCDFETATVKGPPARTGNTVHTDRGDLSAPLIVDALGWRRILGAGANVQPPDARLSRGLEIHPHSNGEDLELWIDPKYVRRGYSWSFPADGELRVGVGSFDPRDHVKEPTLQLAADVGVPAERWQGNWIPHELRPAVEDGIFFVGDSAGHCLPTTAEGIRPAFYFGLAAGRELRDVLDGRQTREQALERYGSFSADHLWSYRWMLRVQHLVGRVTPTRLLPLGLRMMNSGRFVDWSFRHYLDICPPEYALASPPAPSAEPLPAAAA